VNEIEAIAQYLPRALLSPHAARRWWEQPGTLLFSDVSGFTALSEKLARHGKVGAEEMVNAISTVFTPLLDVIDRHDGDVLKFGGDALLTFFSGEKHHLRAAACAHRMRQVLRTQGRVRTPFGTVPLGMSQGMHSGDFFFFVCGSDYADLIATGPAVSATLAMETAAERGEVLLSPATAGALPPRLLRPGHDGGMLLAAPPNVEVDALPEPPQPSASAATFIPLALRGRLADIVSDSEHRQATVGFLQFTGCDETLDREGPDVLHRKLEAVTDAVAKAADEHAVTVICVDVGADGGKFMLASGAPDAVERDAEMMLRFGLEVLSQDLPLPLRLGVNRGNVFGGRVGGPRRWTYSTMGDPVNLAARVMGKAPPRSILATPSVIELVGPIADVRPVEPFVVKGKARPVEAAVVVGLAQPAAHQELPPTTPFVGRDEELRRITAAWSAARTGTGRVVEIVGEAGSGKSRLVAELVREVKPPQSIRVAGERYHRGSAYFALHLLLRRLAGIPIDADPAAAGELLRQWVLQHAPHLDEWTPLLAVAARARVASTPTVDEVAPEFRAAKLRALLQELLCRAAVEPTLVVLEDAFWYDDASVHILTALLSDIASLPWLVCITRRDEAVGLYSALGFAAEQVGLSQLSPEAALELVRATSADVLSASEATHLAESANRNPFFVLQMTQSWQPGAAQMPASVESVVAARLDQLPLHARRLLRRAAVLGSFVDVDMLAAIAETPITAEAIQPLLGEFLIQEGDERFRFAHDLFRTVAYDSLPFRRRRDLHARAGVALEARGEQEARAALLSLHFEAAAEYAKTWRYAVLGGDRARETYANAEALTLYRRALASTRHLPDLTPTELVRVHEALGDVEELLGHYEDASRTYQRAKRLCTELATRVRLLRKLGIVRERQSRYREALRWYTHAIRGTDSLPGEQASAARAALLVGTASARYRQGRFELAARAARAAVKEAQAAENDADLAHAYFLLDAALTDLHDPGALEYRELALPIYREIGDLVGEADVHNNIGIDAYYEGRLDDALMSYGHSLDCRRRAGDVVGAATAENNIGEVLSDLGRFDEAMAMFEEALAVWRRASYPVGIALACSNLGRVHVRRSDLGEASLLIDEAEWRFEDMGASVLLFETRVRRAELLLASGDILAARALAEELQAVAGLTPPAVGVGAALDRVQGVALLRLGEHEQGTALLRRAIETFEACGMEWDAGAASSELVIRIPQQRTIDLDAAPTVAEPSPVGSRE